MNIQSLLFPTRNLCYLCKDRTDHISAYICYECRERLVFVNKEVDTNPTLNIRGNCLAITSHHCNEGGDYNTPPVYLKGTRPLKEAGDISPRYIDGTFYCLSYNKYLKEAVHGFKFNSKSYLYKPLAELMLITIKEKNLEGFDLVAYVPIHRRKEAIRGYNQSELLALYISQSLGLPLSKNNLTKIKWTKEQNTLNRIQRLKNLKDSFSIRNPNEFKDKKVLLIDDLITTGSTFHECAKRLKESGAREVFCLALTSSKSF